MSVESAKIEDVQVGDEMPDGTIYAGISLDTHKPFYVTPADAPGTYTFNEAATYAKNLDANGHHDFRVPSRGELCVLWDNRNKGKLKGTFNETGLIPGGVYRSSSSYDYFSAWVLDFNDGYHYDPLKDRGFALRCVR